MKPDVLLPQQSPGAWLGSMWEARGRQEGQVVQGSLQVPLHGAGDKQGGIAVAAASQVPGSSALL